MQVNHILIIIDCVYHTSLILPATPTVNIMLIIRFVLIIPHGNPKAHGNYIIWPFWMVIQGKLVAYAIGEQEYQPTNRTMTWGDACEGAKSNALMRLCKNMGISLELWQPSFIRGWKSKYAEMYETKNRQGQVVKLWRRKRGAGRSLKADEAPIPEPEDNNPTKEQKTQISKLMEGVGIVGQEEKKAFWEYITAAGESKELANKVIASFGEYHQAYSRMLDAQEEEETENE